MAKKITNTLTRWHKIAERIKTAAKEQEMKNLQALQSARNLDADTFSVRKTSLRTATEKAVGAQTDLYFALQRTLFSIRRAMAKANTEYGVSDLLNSQEEAKQGLAYYDRLLATTEGTLSQEEFSALALLKNAEQRVYGVAVTFLTAEEITEMSERRNAMQRDANGLADRLAEANASKLTLEIDDSVVQVIGL